MTRQTKPKASVKKKPVSQTGARNIAARQSTAVKSLSKKSATNKTAAKKPVAQKSSTQKKSPTKKSVAKKTTVAKKPIQKTKAKKTPVKNTVKYRVKNTSPLLKTKTARPKKAQTVCQKPGKTKSIIYLGHAPRWNFQEHLYLPLVESHFSTDFELVLAHQHQSVEPTNTKEIIRNSNVMLAEVSYPSTGLGIEMGWAEEFDVPIIAFYQHGRSPTQCLKIVAHDVFAYGTSRDLIAKLNKRLHIESVDNLIEYTEDEDIITQDSDF